MGSGRLITLSVVALVKFPILPIGILGANYFAETDSKAVDCFDYVFKQLHLESIILPEGGRSYKMFLGT